MYHGADCRLCSKILESMTEDKVDLKSLVLQRSLVEHSYALKLTGQGEYVSVYDHKRLRLSDRYTLALWIKPASFGDQRLIDKNYAGKVTGYNFDVQAGDDGRGYVRLCAGGGCYYAKRGIYKDVWSHVAVVYSSEHPSIFDNFVSLYINGVLDHTETVFVPTGQEALPLTFGRISNVDRAASFDGLLDNIYIFDRDLTDEQIQELMFGMPSGDEPGLVGFWSFDEEIGETAAYDWSDNGYHGKLYNGALKVLSIDKPLTLNRCL